MSVSGLGVPPMCCAGTWARCPSHCLQSLAKLETEIQQGMKELKGMLK